MPLPLIIGGVVLGAIIGAVVILSLKEFFEKVKKRKEELERIAEEERKKTSAQIKNALKKKLFGVANVGLTGAKVDDLSLKKDCCEVDVGLYANGRKIGSETYKVDKDEAKRELRKGMTLWKQK